MPLTTLPTLLAVLLGSLLFTYKFILPATLRHIGNTLRNRTAHTRQLLLKSTPQHDPKDVKLIGFFHPYCNAGGGGERVLWAAIRAIQHAHPSHIAVVYTGDHDATAESILANIRTRFDITLDASRVHFLYLTTRHFVAAATWPHFTLAGQSLGSLLLAYDAFTLCVPDAFIDTMGYAFTLPLAKALFGIPVGAYVHYPTISTDMLGALPGSSLRTHVKRLYWRAFAAAYRACGAGVDVVMANSTWTAGHMRELWAGREVAVLFPPCAVGEIAAATPRERDAQREKVLLCIAQFRPEKKHELLIGAFARFRERTRDHKDAKLVLLGSVRHKEDAMRVYQLRVLAREKGVADSVEFVTDASWAEVKRWLGRSWAGVNAMWNEHFGIGVVEYLAGGLVGVVHNSGGPKLDIVVDGTGVHCETEEEFADGFEKVLSLPQEEIAEMRVRAREVAGRFDEETFRRRWLEEYNKLVERL